MNDNSTLFKCCRCGYSFEPQGSLRCPRCYNPMLTCGGCSGSCGSCSARSEAEAQIVLSRAKKHNPNTKHKKFLAFLAK